MSNKDSTTNIILQSSEKNEQVKRPMNAFMLWSKQKRREISKQDPTLHNAQISKLLGEQWKLLSPDEKLPFVEESQKLMVKHKKEHPNYRYKPRQNKLTKTKGYPSYTPHIIIDNKSEYEYDSKYPYKYQPIPSIEMEHNLSYYGMPSRHHRPYYIERRYSGCNVPGCYECHSRRRSPYGSKHFSSSRYSYDILCDRNSGSAVSCRCCSLSPSQSSSSSCSPSSTSRHAYHSSDYHWDYDFHNRKASSSPSSSTSSPSTNFSVESLIATRKDNRSQDAPIETEARSSTDDNNESS